MSHLVQFTHFLPHLNVANFEHLLQQLSWKIGAVTPLDMTWVYAQLIHFEKLGSSAIGGGVLIPHLKSTPLEKPLTLLATLNTGVDVASDDEKPSDICAVLLSPEGDGPLHLQRLARITRLLRDENICAQIREAKTEDDLRATFTNFDMLQIAA